MILLFSITLFLSAALLFLVELMFAKMALPLLGGAPAVWITSLLFFQGMLLAGYAYAHASGLRLGTRRQAAVHLVVVFLPLLVLPIAVPEGWTPPATGNPAPWLLALLLVALGLPFFVLSSTTPLLQRWFASTGHASARDPYFLYRASNLGSMLALIAYPFLIEPNIRLADQSRAWTAGYALLLALTVGCAVALWRSPRTGSLPESPYPGGKDEPLTRTRRLRWLGLAFVPSGLTLGVTTYLTTDIAPIPLLWIVPLSLYLLSFVLVFSPRHERLHRFMVRALPLPALPLAILILLGGGAALWAAGPLYLFTFFAAAMVCHGELARDRPSAGRLTEFYLWIAAGGVLGGVFAAIIAPVVFDSVLEFPLLLVAACLFRPALKALPAGPRTRRGDFTLPLIVGGSVVAVSLIISVSNPSAELLWGGLAYGVAAIFCFSFADRPIRFGLGLAAILLAGILFPLGRKGDLVFADRSFFGTYTVVEDRERDLRFLYSGNTVHGAQSLEQDGGLEPLTYYTRSGPVGRLFDAIGDVPRAGLVGLGTGSMACYAQPGDRWTFYEIDPVVERVARDPNLFSYLRDCPGTYDVVLGDARLSLQRAQEGEFDVLVMDAFDSDAIPVHLLTREALGLYLSKLRDGGIIVLHVSNRYLDLAPVAGDLAGDAGLVAYASDGRVTKEEFDAGALPSDWVVLARSESDLGTLLDDGTWHVLKPRPGAQVWTDDFSNILSAFDFGNHQSVTEDARETG